MSTTPRRSNRLSGNPLVIRNPKPKSTSESYNWTSEPVHSRPSIRDDFLDDSEWEHARDDDDDEDNEEEDAEGRNIMTDFYDGFVVSGKKNVGKFSRFTRGVKKSRPKRGKGKGKEKEEGEVYKIGDTVLVTSVNRLPSVGVIVGMWENRWEIEGEETQKMRVKIHWFLRPTELAGIRAKREHAAVRMHSFPLCLLD
jgi:origin recognition complex subunit 1